MSASNLALSALIAVAFVWVGLSIWNQTARTRLDRMQPEIRAAGSALVERYQAQGQRPPPFYWSLRDERLVEYPPEDVTWTDGTGETATGTAAPQFATVRSSATSDGERWPFWAWGLVVGFVPRLLFHGVFGAAVAGLALLWFRLHAV